MRLERVFPALAIVLSLLASAAPAVASSGPSASILSPTDGATVGPGAPITVEYRGWSLSATHLAGYFLLDGEWAGGFTRVLPHANASSNGTRFDAGLDAADLASGAHALQVVVFTETDAPMTSEPVGIVLDHPPRVTASAWYDLGERALHVLADVIDEDVASVNLTVGKNWTAASFVGTQELVLPVGLGPGSYVARLNATDMRGAWTEVSIPFTVGDRPAQVEILEARYEIGGWLVFSASATDADGGVRHATVAALGSSAPTWPRNGTWEARVGIAPRLGVHNGSFTTVDAWGGKTTTPFTFAVGGEREVVFEREIVTQDGAYADHFRSALGGVLDGRIEICPGSCEPANDTGLPEQNIAWGALNATYDAASALPAAGSALNGTWGGTFAPMRFCTPTAPANPIAYTAAYTAFMAADAALANATTGAPDPAIDGFRLCRDHEPTFDSVGSRAPTAPTTPAEGVRPDRTTFVRVSIEGSAGPNATAKNCTSTGESATCTFDASPRANPTLDVTWSQAGARTVLVRVTGIRV